jgi:hypothetical protein
VLDTCADQHQTDRRSPSQPRATEAGADGTDDSRPGSDSVAQLAWLPRMTSRRSSKMETTLTKLAIMTVQARVDLRVTPRRRTNFSA